MKPVKIDTKMGKVNNLKPIQRIYVQTIRCTLMVFFCCFISLEFAFCQSKEVKIELLNYLVKNHKLDLDEGDNMEKYIPYLVITEMVKLDHDWNRDYGIYRFEIHSESAPDMLIKIKDKYYIQNPEKLDETIEAIINLGKSSREYFKSQDILLYIENAIKIYRDNEYVKNERVIG